MLELTPKRSIDNAFIDRADIKQYIGPPPAEAIYSVLSSCAEELMRVGLVQNQTLSNGADAAERLANGSQDHTTRALWHLAESCVVSEGQAFLFFCLPRTCSFIRLTYPTGHLGTDTQKAPCHCACSILERRVKDYAR